MEVAVLVEATSCICGCRDCALVSLLQALSFQPDAVFGENSIVKVARNLYWETFQVSDEFFERFLLF